MQRMRACVYTSHKSDRGPNTVASVTQYRHLVSKIVEGLRSKLMRAMRMLLLLLCMTVVVVTCCDM